MNPARILDQQDAVIAAPAKLNLNCPFLEQLGVQLVNWQKDFVEMSLSTGDSHRNRSGIVQGGVVAALLDAACGYSGLFCESETEQKHATTIMLSICFVAPAKLSDELHIIGRITGQGRKVFFASAEVRNATGNLIASAQGSFKRRTSHSQHEPGKLA